ncbi:hypothetical protein U1Q18_026426 [Sarracenia purpurea var. burkii]
MLLKELKELWEKHEPDLPWEKGEFNASNTLLLDDSPYKALCNPNGDQVANARHVARAHHNVVDRNPLIVLFESMLPWIDYGSSDGVGEHDDQYNVEN